MSLFRFLGSFFMLIAVFEKVQCTEVKCEYSTDKIITIPHEDSKSLFYECDPSGFYVERHCRRGYIFDANLSVTRTFLHPNVEKQV